MNPPLKGGTPLLINQGCINPGSTLILPADSHAWTFQDKLEQSTDPQKLRDVFGTKNNKFEVSVMKADGIPKIEALQHILFHLLRGAGGGRQDPHPRISLAQARQLS